MKHRNLTIRVIASLMCLIFVFQVAACSKSAEPIESTEEELRGVGAVGDYTVPYEEFRFAVLTCRTMLVGEYGESFLKDADATDRIRKSVYDNITYNYAILSMCREVGIFQDDPKLLEKVQQTVQETVNELGSRKKYLAYLQENGMTDHFFRFNTMVDLMQNELYYVYRDDLGLIATDYETVYNKIRREFANITHIYIAADSDSAKERIEQAYASLQNGTDFLTVMKEYGEDSQMGEDGMYIPKGYMSDTYEEKAFSLEIGDYSEIFTDGNGYYILYRRAISPEYVMTNYDTLSKRYQDYAFLAMIAKTQEELSFVPNAYGESLDVLTIN